jgi:hypothetical protein
MDRKLPPTPPRPNGSLLETLLNAFGGGALAYFVVVLIVLHLLAFFYWLMKLLSPTPQIIKRE